MGARLLGVLAWPLRLLAWVALEVVLHVAVLALLFWLSLPKVTRRPKA